MEVETCFGVRMLDNHRYKKRGGCTRLRPRGGRLYYSAK